MIVTSEVSSRFRYYLKNLMRIRSVDSWNRRFVARRVERSSYLIRIIFDKPRRLRRIRLEFAETEIERTQEFTLRCSVESVEPLRDIARQKWSFSPHGSTSEVEDYRVDLNSVCLLELALKSDLTPGNALATLAK